MANSFDAADLIGKIQRLESAMKTRSRNVDDVPGRVATAVHDMLHEVKVWLNKPDGDPNDLLILFADLKDSVADMEPKEAGEWTMWNTVSDIVNGSVSGKTNKNSRAFREVTHGKTLSKYVIDYWMKDKSDG